jgi:hypothetical protein
MRGVCAERVRKLAEVAQIVGNSPFAVRRFSNPSQRRNSMPFATTRPGGRIFAASIST